MPPAVKPPTTAAKPPRSGGAPRGGKKGRPTQPPANQGAAVGRKLDNLGRDAADAPIFSQGQRAAVSGGSIMVGLVAYAIGVAYLQHGWPGVTAWLKAKLFNETAPGPAVVPAMLFHTGTGSSGGSAAGTQLAAAAPPAYPTAPTPSGGTLYA